MGIEIEVNRTDFLDLDFIKEGDILDIEDGMELITHISKNAFGTAKELDGDVYAMSYKTENGIVSINKPEVKLKMSEHELDSYLFYYCKLINSGLI